MKNSVNFFVYALVLTGIIFSACENKEQKVDQAIIEASDSSSASKSSESQAATKIEFEESQFDFGKINKGEMVTHVFKFKNSGTAPLVIVDAKASCGCTVPQWTKDPVMPGESGDIEVKYNGSGSGKIHKTVTVYANTEPKETVLEIMADVKDIDLNNKGPLKQ